MIHVKQLGSAKNWNPVLIHVKQMHKPKPQPESTDGTV